MIISCEDFSASYQRVDAGAFRLLNIQYYPAEAAPGDIVTLTAVFAGKEIDLEKLIDWRVSYNMLVDHYGTLTAVDDKPLEYHEIQTSFFSGNTQAVNVRFKIPEDCVRRSGSIPNNWADLVPSYVKSSIPQELLSMTKDEMVDLIEAYDRYLKGPHDNFTLDRPMSMIKAASNEWQKPQYSEELHSCLNTILQFFTVPIRISANVKGEHTIQSTYSVRYNGKFYSLDINYNNNPDIGFVRVYKVKGKNQLGFDESDPFVDFFGYWPAIIEVEDGYTYIAEAIVYANSIDYSVTLGGVTVEEEYRVYWQFQLDEDEIKGIPYSKYMDITSVPGQLGAGPFAWIIPPADKRITKFTLWVSVTDHVTNERLRPQGSALAEFRGYFTYK
jgi:hypothetical protein